jgi:cbb3-type cytochrome oxidase maturation protein
MEVIFVLIPVSLLIVILAIWAFVWSVRTDQYEDLEKEAFRILIDDEFIDNEFIDNELVDDVVVNEAPVNEMRVNEAFVDEMFSKGAADNVKARSLLLNPLATIAPTALLLTACSEINPNNDRSAS